MTAGASFAKWGLGLFVFDAIWPAFNYSPVAVGKNARLLRQAFFLAFYVLGALLAFDAARRALDVMSMVTRRGQS